MSCSACEGGLNQIVSLTVPGNDRADGPSTDVSALVGSKSVEISGTYDGSYVIMGSHDGAHPVPLLVFNSGAGAQAFKQTINLVMRFMFVRRRATNTSTVTVRIGSRATCACPAIEIG
jgi:hypothetical protein